MSASARNSRRVRFADFTLDPQTAELWQNGNKCVLQDQSLKILEALLENPGELVRREALVKRLWPVGTYVDFDQSLNKAVARLREALGDSSEHPRMIETLPRRGYRLITPVAADIELDVPSNSARSNFQRNPQFRSGHLNRFFLLFGTTPYKQWEVMQVRILIWCVLIGVLGWSFSTRVSSRWGVTLFLVESICIAFLMIIASYLVYVGALQRESLSEEIRKTAPWMRGLIIGLVLISWMMAGCVFDSHLGLAALLTICGTAGGLKYTLFKTRIDRAILAGSIEPS